ncbi:uncharacterized protein BT62DRAFT_1074026 [Guyanagaster necrorhizus]|uniref:Uncharacterized protein n=1 Tax=Guyanagaster necrorhizus TaxID=856835 RepID=A0A9P7VWW4_9AGAR|nr:uncharacterized protein BT62DRAFT_1074026 [Guyanagaster necrorhizus MCA 3950]KAG7448449.1 hypothetical protein BT62DRAFT_1074026 [Guyanagaster necrorhizus MCA 3950]
MSCEPLQLTAMIGLVGTLLHYGTQEDGQSFQSFRTSIFAPSAPTAFWSGAEFDSSPKLKHREQRFNRGPDSVAPTFQLSPIFDERGEKDKKGTKEKVIPCFLKISHQPKHQSMFLMKRLIMTGVNRTWTYTKHKHYFSHSTRFGHEGPVIRGRAVTPKSGMVFDDQGVKDRKPSTEEIRMQK